MSENEEESNTRVLSSWRMAYYLGASFCIARTKPSTNNRNTIHVRGTISWLQSIQRDNHTVPQITRFAVLI